MFPLFQARSLKAVQDNTSTELAELRKMMKETMKHFQQEVKVMQDNTSTQLQQEVKVMQDNTSTQLDELREMMRNVMQHLQQKVTTCGNVISSYIYVHMVVYNLSCDRRKGEALHRKEKR